MAASSTLTVNGGMLTFSGVIAGSGLALSKAGTGTLILNGANSFSGGATLSAGLLNLGNASALGGSAGTVNFNGGSIDNTSGADIGPLANPLANTGDIIYLGGGVSGYNLTLGGNLKIWIDI